MVDIPQPEAAQDGQAGKGAVRVAAIAHDPGIEDTVAPGGRTPAPARTGAAGTGGMGIRVASWYPAPEAGLNPSQLADVYASLALRMAGARQPWTRTAPRNP